MSSATRMGEISASRGLRSAGVHHGPGRGMLGPHPGCCPRRSAPVPRLVASLLAQIAPGRRQRLLVGLQLAADRGQARPRSGVLGLPEEHERALGRHRHHIDVARGD
jgi:hypothetical protein